MAGLSRHTVDFYYDIVSPFTYFAFELICYYKDIWDIDLKFHPFSIEDVLQKNNNPRPFVGNNIKLTNKETYLMQDMHRLARIYNIPFNFPKKPRKTLIKQGPVPALRLLVVVTQKKPELTQNLTRTLFKRLWVKDQDIFHDQGLLEACQESGLSLSEAERFLNESKQPTASQQLNKNTQEAVDYGAFGTPTFMLEDMDGIKQLVFGSDRMQVIAMLLDKPYTMPFQQKAKL